MGVNEIRSDNTVDCSTGCGKSMDRQAAWTHDGCDGLFCDDCRREHDCSATVVEEDR